MGLCALVALATAGTAPGCRDRPDETSLVNAYHLGEGYRWEEAMPMVRAYLLARPDSAPGHFLWGCCYLHGPAPFLEIARGELEYALVLLHRSHDLGPLGALLREAQFEAQIQLKLALVYMRRAHQAISNGIPPRLVDQQLGNALEHVRLGRALDPGSSTLAEMEQTLSRLGKGTPQPEPRREDPAAAPAL